jgi:hypothetical protein
MSNTGENAQSRAIPSSEGLEWQSELDSAMSDIDSRLRHPRRRASDKGAQPQLPELGQIELTSELLDEISWRVSEQIRRTQAFASAATPPVANIPPTAAAPEPAAPAMPDGVAIVIRFRWPLFRLPFGSGRSRRRKREAMIQLSDYGITP